MGILARNHVPLYIYKKRKKRNQAEIVRESPILTCREIWVLTNSEMKFVTNRPVYMRKDQKRKYYVREEVQCKCKLTSTERTCSSIQVIQQTFYHGTSIPR